MLEEGLVEEVRRLVEQGYGRGTILERTIGYAEVLDHLDGLIDETEMRDRIRTNTWRLSRRQKNMLRRLEGTVSWDGRDVAELHAIICRGRN